MKYEQEIVEKIGQDAELARSERTTEKELEQKALEAARNEVKELKVKDAELRTAPSPIARPVRGDLRP